MLRSSQFGSFAYSASSSNRARSTGSTRIAPSSNPTCSTLGTRVPLSQCDSTCGATSTSRASSRRPSSRASLAARRPKPSARDRGVATRVDMGTFCHRTPTKTGRRGRRRSATAPAPRKRTQPIRPDKPLPLKEPQPVTWSYPVPAVKPVVPCRVLLPVVTSWKPVPYEDPLPIE